MRRAWVVLAVLVVGAWSCVPVTTGGGAVATTDDEGWIYVGSGGDAPDFGTDWENVGNPWTAMAFRLREAGIVDLVGAVAFDGFTDPSAVVFTLPEGYRPPSGRQAFVGAYFQYTGSPQRHEAGLLTIGDDGDVTPAGPGLVGGSSIAYVSGSFFVDTPETAP